MGIRVPCLGNQRTDKKMGFSVKAGDGKDNGRNYKCYWKSRRVYNRHLLVHGNVHEYSVTPLDL